MRRHRERGFTLIELVIALSIVSALLVATFGALRVGLGAWRRGEDRAELLEHARSLTQIVERAVEGTNLYRPGAGETTEARLLFEGDADRLAFVTVSPPFPAPVPVAFTAVTFSLETGAAPGLAIRQKVLPNTAPFEAVPPAFVDASVAAVLFRYLREAGGQWEEKWDASKEKALPFAVEATFTTLLNGRRIEHAPLVIPLRVIPS